MWKTHLLICMCLSLNASMAMRLTLFNPTALYQEAAAYEKTFSSEHVDNPNPPALQFSLALDSKVGSVVQKNALVNPAGMNLCFQLNGKDCHCFQNVTDISSFVFTVPSVCQVELGGVVPISRKNDQIQMEMQNENPITWFSVKIYLGFGLNNENDQDHDHGNDNGLRIVSSPIALRNGRGNGNIHQKMLLTMILPLTLDDLSRASLLAQTLSSLTDKSIHELIIITPDSQRDVLHASLVPLLRGNFPVRVIAESTLFSDSNAFISSSSGGRAYPYSIQMSLKLLIARIVQTSFYMTLDADMLLLKPLRILETIKQSFKSKAAIVNEHVDVDIQGEGEGEVQAEYAKAIFEDEDRSVHSAWWSGSAHLLDIRDSPRIDSIIKRPSVLSTEKGTGFSVTPAVLSSFGSILVLEDILLAQRRCHGFHLSDTEAEIAWLLSFGKPSAACKALEHTVNVTIWSEYTLYRLVLDKFNVFQELHEPQQEDELMLHCHDVWFAGQLPWDATAAYNSNCLFSVVQSSTGVSPSKIWSQLQ